MELPITLTESAVNNVLDAMKDSGMEELHLRIYVSGGGCSGLQYGMALDQMVEEDDQIFDFSGIKVILSPMDMKYLKGAVVDYVETSMGGGFKVDNPNALKSCGCGSSFAVEDDVAGKTLTGNCGSCRN